MERNSATRKTTIDTKWAIAMALSSLLAGSLAIYSAAFSTIHIENLGSDNVSVPILYTFWSWMQQNQLMQTIFFGSVGTSTYFVLQRFYQLVVKRFFSYFRCEVTIYNMDPSYKAVIDYVTVKFLKEQAGATSNMQVQ